MAGREPSNTRVTAPQLHSNSNYDVKRCWRRLYLFKVLISSIKMKWMRNPTPWIIFGFNSYTALQSFTEAASTVGHSLQLTSEVGFGSTGLPTPNSRGWWDQVRWWQEWKCSTRVGPHIKTNMSYTALVQQGKCDQCVIPFYIPT
jgi:hypothetical protein